MIEIDTQYIVEAVFSQEATDEGMNAMLRKEVFDA